MFLLKHTILTHLKCLNKKWSMVLKQESYIFFVLAIYLGLWHFLNTFFATTEVGGTKKCQKKTVINKKNSIEQLPLSTQHYLKNKFVMCVTKNLILAHFA